MTETLQVGEWPRERAVPVSNGRLAMWLFLSTEVMFFAALLSSYAIFRISAEDWPTPADVNVNKWIGLLNTVVLLGSSVTLSWTVRSLRTTDRAAARRWLLVTLLLGTGFLVVKGFEFSDKWRHGIFNWGESPLIHDRADLHYLAHLKSTLRVSTAAVAGENSGTVEGSPAPALDEWSRIVVGGLVDWTGQFVGQESDPALRRRALANTAALVYPHRSLEPAGLANELAVLKTDLAARRQQIDGDQLALKQLQDAISALSHGQPDTELTESQRAQLVEWTGEANELSQKMTREKLVFDPVRDRVSLLERTEPHWDRGLVKQHGMRLPLVIPHGQTWASLYLLLVGCHALHVVGGLVAMLCCWPGRDEARSGTALGNLSLYWYFVDLVWIGLFLLIYFEWNT